MNEWGAFLRSNECAPLGGTYDPEAIMTMKGTFDQVSQQYSGTWEQISGGTKCFGAWQTGNTK
jgi:hypothetical protein